MNNIFLIQELRGVFVTNNCVIIDKGSIVKASCVKDEFYKKYLQPKFRLKYFFPIFPLTKKIYILATDEWSKNYCHFMWEVLSKVIDLKKESPEANLILPKSYLEIDHVMKALEAFGFGSHNITTVPKKARLLAKSLFFIPCINISTAGYYDYLKFREIAKTLVSYYQEKFKTNYGNRIYISRSDAKKDTARKISNEKELTAMLAKYGIKTVYMENFSFLEQLSIASNAGFILAPHGAGITNAMFAKKNSHLFEMVSKKWGKTCFAEMCDRIDIQYHHFYCDEVDNKKGTCLNDIKVDVAGLEKELIKILK